MQGEHNLLKNVIVIKLQKTRQEQKTSVFDIFISVSPDNVPAHDRSHVLVQCAALLFAS